MRNGTFWATTISAGWLSSVVMLGVESRFARLDEASAWIRTPNSSPRASATESPAGEVATRAGEPSRVRMLASVGPVGENDGPGEAAGRRGGAEAELDAELLGDVARDLDDRRLDQHLRAPLVELRDQLREVGLDLRARPHHHGVDVGRRLHADVLGREGGHRGRRPRPWARPRPRRGCPGLPRSLPRRSPSPPSGVARGPGCRATRRPGWWRPPARRSPRPGPRPARRRRRTAGGRRAWTGTSEGPCRPGRSRVWAIRRTSATCSGLPRTRSALLRGSTATCGAGAPSAPPKHLLDARGELGRVGVLDEDRADLVAVALRRADRAISSIRADVLGHVGDDERVGLGQRLDVAEGRDQRPERGGRRGRGEVAEAARAGSPRRGGRWRSGILEPAAPLAHLVLRDHPPDAARAQGREALDPQHRQEQLPDAPPRRAAAPRSPSPRPRPAESRTSVRPVISETCSASARMSASRRLMTKLAGSSASCAAGPRGERPEEQRQGEQGCAHRHR